MCPARQHFHLRNDAQHTSQGWLHFYLCLGFNTLFWWKYSPSTFIRMQFQILIVFYEEGLLKVYWRPFRIKSRAYFRIHKDFFLIISTPLMKSLKTPSCVAYYACLIPKYVRPDFGEFQSICLWVQVHTYVCVREKMREGEEEEDREGKRERI